MPAENAARLMGVQADEWTAQNIEVMREQLKRTGVKFDWDRVSHFENASLISKSLGNQYLPARFL